MSTLPVLLLALLLSLAPRPCAATTHSFEFVAEHLPEVAMDNRFATLPLWGATAEPWQFTVQGGASRIGSGGLALAGPLASAAVHRRLDAQWSLTAFGFVDRLRFSGGGDQRPLETLFTQVPLALPAQASFTDLQGRYRNTGAGLAFHLREHGWLGERLWVIGALVQRVTLGGYRAAYRLLDGASAGAGGSADYSAVYTHVTPLVGLALPRECSSWCLTPHALLAVPIPRRGIRGRITGPGFDLSGDTEKAGNGKHFGDVSVTFGLDLRYQPWDLSIDLGSALSQALLERAIHPGVDRNWLISVYKRF